MELINSQIDKIEDALSDMDEIIVGAKGIPFSGKINVDKESLFHLIDIVRGITVEMRKGLPSEINQAKRLINDKDNHLNEARAKAEMMLRAAEGQAAQMVDEHEITLHAKQVADKLSKEAEEEIRQFKMSAADYIDGVFGDLTALLHDSLEKQQQKTKDLEDFYNNLLEDVQRNRQTIPTE